MMPQQIQQPRPNQQIQNEQFKPPALQHQSREATHEMSGSGQPPSMFNQQQPQPHQQQPGNLGQMMGQQQMNPDFNQQNQFSPFSTQQQQPQFPGMMNPYQMQQQQMQQQPNMMGMMPQQMGTQGMMLDPFTQQYLMSQGNPMMQQNQMMMMQGFNGQQQQQPYFPQQQPYMDPSMMGPGGYNQMQQQIPFIPNQMQNFPMMQQPNQFNQQPLPIKQQEAEDGPDLAAEADIIHDDDNQANHFNSFNQMGQQVQIPPFDYQFWLLEPNERIESVALSKWIPMEEIKRAVDTRHNVDTLYLVKWKQLSYIDTTWEPFSMISMFQEQISDFFNFNRSADMNHRHKLFQAASTHKKLVRLTEKKFAGKKKNHEFNEQLLDQHYQMLRQLHMQRIFELVGPTPRFIQYSYNRGYLPQFKKNQLLKPYQVTGLNWLVRAFHEQRNVVLADEMGLGKTIMTIAFFDHLHKELGLKGPFLILAPLTTLEHWKKIAEEWTNLNTVLYYDTKGADGRQEIRNTEWYYTDITQQGKLSQKSELVRFNVIITSFEVLMQDLETVLLHVPFTYIVVDEAHRLKNKQAKSLKMLKEHPCKGILLLTGTPVQNNIKELWTLLNYIEPTKFNDIDLFMQHFGTLETAEQVMRLNEILRPHFLRRLKDEVDNTIPPLNETVIEVGLTNIQNTYYKSIYSENKALLARFGQQSLKQGQFNNMDIQLRKCCNHLFLLKGVEEELTKDCIGNPQALTAKILDCSGKMILLEKFIDKFRVENNKMLIFSQFKRMLEIIQIYLQIKNIPFEVLTGSVKNQDRVSAINRFNDDKSFGVFLLTTRAGGLGINLTSAQVVIIFDSDWNPQNDLQAIARAHRIGQEKEVKVYRFITSKTYEEQMFERASKKLGMEHALFSKGAFNNEGQEDEYANISLKGLTDLRQDSKEIEKLLKFGAYAFIEGDDDPNHELVNKSIDEILQTGKRKDFKYNKGSYILQKSTFNVQQFDKLPDLNDPNFWNKVLPMDSISISILEKRFKKEKKDLGSQDRLQTEFMKDLEIAVNDFFEAKFDLKSNSKDFADDEEKLRYILTKLVNLVGMRFSYKQKCRDWIDDLLSNRRIIRQVDSDDDNIIHDNDDDEPDNQFNHRHLGAKRTAEEAGLPSLKTQPQLFRGQGLKPVSKNKPEFPEAQRSKGWNRGRFERKCKGKTQYEDGNEGYDISSDFDAEGQKPMKTAKGYKIQQMIQRKNEKNGIVCGVCYHPEPPFCKLFCTGICNRYFHIDCAKKIWPDAELEPSEIWRCPDCVANTYRCFACQNTGQVVTARGGLRQQSHMNLEEVFSHLQKQGDDDKIQALDIKPIEEIVQSEKNGEETNEQKIEGQVQVNKAEADQEVNPEENLEKQIYAPIEQAPDVINQVEAANEIKNDQEEFKQSDIPKEIDTFIYKCSLGTCLKYYHFSCLHKLPNATIIHGPPVLRFMCPLHYCAVCKDSGDSKLICQCVQCPVACHVKCLGNFDEHKKLTRKYIRCTRHEQEGPQYEPPPIPEEELMMQRSNQSLIGHSSTSHAQQTLSGRRTSKVNYKERDSDDDEDYKQGLKMKKTLKVALQKTPSITKIAETTVKKTMTAKKKIFRIEKVNRTGLNEKNLPPLLLTAAPQQNSKIVISIGGNDLLGGKEYSQEDEYGEDEGDEVFNPDQQQQQRQPGQQQQYNFMPPPVNMPSYPYGMNFGNMSQQQQQMIMMQMMQQQFNPQWQQNMMMGGPQMMMQPTQQQQQNQQNQQSMQGQQFGQGGFPNKTEQ